MSRLKCDEHLRARGEVGVLKLSKKKKKKKKIKLHGSHDTTPWHGQYLTHAHSHITRAVAAMDKKELLEICRSWCSIDRLKKNRQDWKGFVAGLCIIGEQGEVKLLDTNRV